MSEARKKFSDVDGFIDLLIAACEDPSINDTLERLLVTPDVKRKDILKAVIFQMEQRGAPPPLRDAFICLLDDAAAEKAYEVIYQCKREGRDAS